MDRYFAYQEDITEKDGFVIEEFDDKLMAEAFCDVMGFTYYEYHDDIYNPMQDKKESIRMAVNHYLSGKSKHIEINHASGKTRCR